MAKKKMQMGGSTAESNKFTISSKNKISIPKKTMKSGGEVAAGVGPTPKRVGPVDPKGAYTKVQERTLAKSKAGKPSLTKDKEQGATKMKKGGMVKKCRYGCK